MSQALQRSPDGPPANSIGSPFIELQSVDSTNNYARRQIHAGLAQHGMAIFAHEQTSGKGQRGRTWTSEKDKNIALSILINPAPLTIDRQFELSACTAVAVHAFFSKYADDNARIKWPNDLYWQDRKAGGILIESGVRSRESAVGSSRSDVGGRQSDLSGWEWAIVGIGININQTVFPGDLPNPVSLKQITGKEHDPVMLARDLCGVFNQFFKELITTGFESIFRQYNQYLYKRGETIRLKKDNRVFVANIITVSHAGKLITQHAMEEEFGFEEIQWLIE